MRAVYRVGSTGIAVLAAVAPACLWAVPAAAAPTTIAEFGHGAGRVSNPKGVAVNRTGAGEVEAGTLYVADHDNFRVDRFGSDGEFQLAWGWGVADGRSEEFQICGPESGRPVGRCFRASSNTAAGAGAVAPEAVAVDEGSGDVYVADERNRISAFSPSGQFLRAFGGGVASGGAAGMGDTEAGSEVIRSVSATSRAFLAGQAIAGAGIQPGTVITRVEKGFFSTPPSLRLSKPATTTAAGVPISAPEASGNVAQNEVQEISLQAGITGGNFKLGFVAPEYELFSPETTANIPFNASAGEVQAALEALARIPAGSVEVSSANPGGGSEPGGPYTVEFSGERYADTNIPQLQTAKGEPDLSGGKASVAVATLQEGAGAAEVCTAAGECVAGISGDGPGQLANPRSLAFDPSGDLWVGDANRLLRFDAGGAFLSELPLPGAGGTKALAIDSAGDFYLRSEALPGVRKLHPGGAPYGAPYPLDAAGSPEAIGLDGEDNVYLGDRTSPYRLLAFTAAGEQFSRFGTGQVIGSPAGNALAVDDEAGTLYVASSDIIAASAVQAFPLPEPGPLPEGQEAQGLLPRAATLTATLNPEGHETTFRFQYLTEAEWEAQGESFEGPATEQTPEETLEDEGAPYEGFDGKPVSAYLEGLTPATAYRFRLVATNHCDAAEPATPCTVAGPATPFATPTSVGIEAQWVSGVAARSATAHAELQPFGAPASWWVEFDTSPYPAGGAGHGRRTAAFSLAAGSDPVGVSVALTGLEPASAYHYRFVAEDMREGETYLTYGADRGFFTQPAGLDFDLADERAWEMVSPADKYGGSIVAPDPGQGGQVQAAADGDALAYLSNGSLEPTPEGNRLFEQSSELARRGEGGLWSTRDITPPHEEAIAPEIGKGLEYKLFDTGLGKAMLEPLGAPALSPGALARSPYLRTNSSPPGFEALLSTANAPVGSELDGAVINTLGATPDLSHVLLRSSAPLTAAPAASNSLYEWSGGAISPVSVLPADQGGGIVTAEPGSGPGSVRGAVSDGGSRVFFTAFSAGGLYLRDLARGETIRVDEVQEGAFGTGKAAPLFQAASPDGRFVFFTDTRNLTEDANEEGADLYRCEVKVEGGALGCELSDLSAGVAHIGESAEVQGISPGIGADGGSAYFVAKGVLDSAPNGEGEAASPREPNLYVWRQGGGVRFIATLAVGDSPDWGSGAFAFKLSASSSPSGRYLAFMSELPLTGYDNRDAASGARAQEVFRYDASSDELICASCNPSGSRPRALRPGHDIGELAEAFDPQSTWTGHAVAALLPEATKLDDGGTSLYRPRVVHEDGRVFFNAADSLVAADSNGDGDVYEYEPLGTGSCGATAADSGTALVDGGCVSLISSGHAEGTAAFLDASESGDDVFFYTPAPLAVTDEDEIVDVYDARVGGEAARLEPRAECQGEACQPPAAAPQTQTPASAAFRGPGNANEAPRGRCAVRARAARSITRRAGRLHRRARRLARKGTPPKRIRDMNHEAGRLAHRAKRVSRRAKLCRHRARSNKRG